MPVARISELGSGMAWGAMRGVEDGTNCVEGGTRGGGVTPWSEAVDWGTGVKVGGGTLVGKVGLLSNWESAGESLG